MFGKSLLFINIQSMKPNLDKYNHPIHQEQMKQSDQNKWNKASNKLLCLNPNCLLPRLIDIPSNVVHASVHQNCKGWLHPLDFLRNGFKEQNNKDQNGFGSIDYL